MASETIKEFLVGIGFDVDSSGLEKLNSGVKSFAKRFAIAAAAATAAFYGVSKAISSTATKFDALGRRAERLGVGADELQRLGYAAQLSGSSVADAERSFELFSRRIGETAIGTGEAKIVFERLGLDVRKANGEVKTATEMMGEVGARIKDLTRTEQLSILDKLGFQHSMLNVVTGDMAALGAEFDKVYKAANLNSNATAKNAINFQDMLFRMKFGFETFKDALASVVLEPLADTMFSISRRFTEFMAITTRHIQPFVRRVAGFIGGLVKVFGRVLTGIVALIRGIVRPFAVFFSQMPTWAKWVAGLTLAFKGLTIAFAATPIGAVVALGVAIAALVDDYLVWKEQGQSFLDWSAWEPAINSAKAAIESFIEIFKNLFGIIFSVFGIIKNLVTLDFAKAWNQWKVAVDSVCEAFKSLWETFKSIGEFFGNLGGAAMGFFNMVASKMGFGGFDGIAPAQPKVLADVKNAGGGQTNNVQVKTDIIVQGASDPHTTAKIIVDKEAKTLGNAVRDNTAGAM